MPPIAITFHTSPAPSPSASTLTPTTRSRTILPTYGSTTNLHGLAQQYLSYTTDRKASISASAQHNVGGGAEEKAKAPSRGGGSPVDSSSGSGSGSGSTDTSTQNTNSTIKKTTFRAKWPKPNPYPHPTRISKASTDHSTHSSSPPTMASTSTDRRPSTTYTLTPLTSTIIHRSLPSASSSTLTTPNKRKHQTNSNSHAHVHAHGSTTPSRKAGLNSHSLSSVHLSTAMHRLASHSSTPSHPRIAAGPGHGTSIISTHLHPYSRTYDLANTRSTVPSPRELIRTHRAEEERARAKAEAAATRLANKRRTNRTNGHGHGMTSRRGSAGTARTRSNSPSGMINGRDHLSVGLRGRDQESEDGGTGLGIGLGVGGVPTITTEPASTESSPAAVPLPRAPLKRTRSHGLTPISTGIANTASGSATVGVGSPLKAVMSGDIPLDTAAQSTENISPRETKRSRLADAPFPFPLSSSQRASSHSPPGTHTDPLPSSARMPNTMPMAHAHPQPRQVGRRALGLGNGSAGGGVDMRRVVSSGPVALGGGGGGSRGLGRVGSAAPDLGGLGGSGPTATARERSRREVMLPGRLRDYEMKAGVGGVGLGVGVGAGVGV